MNSKESYNPVIGYHIVDRDYRVIGPAGTSMNPAFYSKERALRAAEAYGRREEVREVVALHLDGALSVILHDVGDIQMDGVTARRFVKACRRRGLRVNQGESSRINEATREPVYSCRALLAG